MGHGYGKRDGRVDDARRGYGPDYVFRKNDIRNQEEMDGILDEEKEHYAYGPGAADFVVSGRGCKESTDIW